MATLNGKGTWHGGGGWRPLLTLVATTAVPGCADTQPPLGADDQAALASDSSDGVGATADGATIEGQAGEVGTPELGPIDQEPEQIPPDLAGISWQQDIEGDILAIGARDVLRRHCSRCHSDRATPVLRGAAPALESDDGGGLVDIMNLERLIRLGLIVPGSSAASPLLESIRSGHSPRLPALTAGEMAVLTAFIDGLAVEAPTCERLPEVSYDEIYLALAADIASHPEKDRPFARYIGLHYASNAGVCGPLLQQQRYALFKAVNSVSTGSQVVTPVAIDGRQLLYRVDLRDYGWNRAIDLADDGTFEQADGWQAIVLAAAPYSVELTGAEADRVTLATQTAVPYLPANAFVRATQAGDLYYSLTGARQSIENARLDMGINLAERFAARQAPRAGFAGGYYNWDGFVTRVEQGTQPGRFYWLMDVWDVARGETILNNVLQMDREDWAQAIFNLPNGLQAYSVESSDSQRLGQQTPSGCGQSCYAPERVNAAACHSCHAQGILPVVDVVREFVERNSHGYDAETLAEVPLQYPSVAEFDALIERDSEVHRAALQRAGIPRGEPDRLASVFFGFERAVDLGHASAELMVTQQALRDAIPAAAPALLPLLEGTPIPRATFGQAFSGLLCASTLGANRPTLCR